MIPPPPEGSLEALLAQERARSLDVDAMRERVRASVDRELAAPHASTATPSPPRALAHRPVAAVSLVVGLVIGIGVGRWVFPRVETRTVVHERVVVRAPPLSPPQTAVDAGVDRSDASSPLQPPLRVPLAEHGDRALEQEMALIQIARAAQRRGLDRDALAALARHRREFPRGRLAEERDAMTVQALSALQQTERARDAATQFLARYPHSVLRDRVRQAGLPNAP